MQKHRKYMLVTMWIAVITFIGAGAVDWGGASYGSRASSVAKVGSVEVSNKEFSRLRSNMFEYYRTQFKGEFTEEMAEKFQLNQSVLNQLVMKALTLNMAKNFDLAVSDAEVIKTIQETADFQRDGKFDISLYKTLLKRIRFQNSDYEAQVRDGLLSTKVMAMLEPVAVRAETDAYLTAGSIADKITYKVLDSSAYKVTVNDKDVEKFWGFQKNNFMTEEIISVASVTQKPLSLTPDDKEIEAFYSKYRNEFLDKEGKIVALESAKSAVLSMMNDQATEKAANYLKVAWKNFDHAKKGKDGKVKPFNNKITHTSFNANQAPMSADVLKKIKLLPTNKPYLKAEKVQGKYVIYKLISIHAPRVKTFAEAKAQVFPAYIQEQKKKQLQEELIKSETSFKGQTTSFITAKDNDKIKGLNPEEADIALKSIFKSHKKIGNIAISNSKVLLYEIKEQKLLLNAQNDASLTDMVNNAKKESHSSALIKTLDKMYPTINYLQ